MREMQFTALVLMTLLTMKLLLLPRRAMSNPSMSKARWLMAGGTALLAVQFLLQYKLGLRSVDVTKAVMLNLAFFIPCAALMSLGILCLQRQRRLSWTEKLIVVPVWIIAMTLVVLGVQADGEAFGVPKLLWAEIGASFFYAVMQFYYTVKHIRQLRNIRQALANYYDRDMGGLLNWMQLNIIVLALMALLAPAIIFGHGWWLVLFAILLFVGIFYLVDSFCLYVVSTIPAKVKEAEQSEDETEKTVPEETMQRVERAVAQWTAAGGHLKSGLKLPSAAEEMQIPRYLLSGWLRHTGRHYSEWLADLRIEEAKRTLREHPDWSNEAVAQHCGFNDRCYFQNKFKEMTGMTPAQYIVTQSR